MAQVRWRTTKGVDTSGQTADRIGRYRLLKVLGEGGMGVVHLGEDPDGRKVAIKVLRPQVAADRTAVRRLAREVDTMRRVRSPNVAEILDADVTATQPYIVTQFVPGRTLEEHVLDKSGGPLPGRVLQRVATGLAQALAAIHGAGIIHRDLKPGNVMLVEGSPVLIDFGIAQGLDATRLTATGMVIGTPGYLAPEIIEGEEAGPPADIHAWAATLVFAATARPPFGSGTFESIFYKIMNGTPDLDGVPAPMLPLIKAAMARNPAERPTAVSLVQLARKIDLDTTLTDRTRVDSPASSFGLPDQPTRRERPGESGETGLPWTAGAAGVGQGSAESPRPGSGERDAPWAAGAAAAAGSAMPGTGPRAGGPVEGQSGRNADSLDSGRGVAWGAGAPDQTMADRSAADRLDPPTLPQRAVEARQTPLQQPKDFKGQLPPAAPPPAPPKRQAGPKPYVPPKQSPYVPGRQAYGGQPPYGGQQPYGQQGYPGGYQPYGLPPQAPPPDLATAPDRGRRPAPGTSPDARQGVPQPERRKPYFWYRLCSLASVAVILALSAQLPVIMLVFVLALAVVLRAADKAAKSMESKRVRRGPGAGDVIAAFVKTPLHLPGAIMKTALWGGFGLFVGVVLVIVLMVANADMKAATAISYGVMAVVALQFLGPGSGGSRRQAARVWGAFLPRIEPAVIVALGLAGVAALLWLAAKGTVPSLKPLTIDGSQSVNDLKDSITSKFGIG